MKSKGGALAKYTAAMLIFGTIGIFRRNLPLPSELIAFFRGVIGCGFIAAFMALRKSGGRTNGELKKSAVLRLMLSGAMIGIHWMLLFEAYNCTTVSAATLCYYMAPTFVILLSAVFLRERLTAVKGICAALSFAGMVLVSGLAETGLPQKSELKGFLFGLLAAVLYAAVVMLNKGLTDIDPLKKTIVQIGSAAVVLTPYLFIADSFGKAEWSLTAAALLVVVGIVHTGITYTLYFGSMDGLSAQTIALFSYIDPVTALILSALLLGERMTVFGAAGAVMILGSAAFCELYGGRKEKEK